MNRHVIGREVIELSLQRAGDPYALQQRVADVLERHSGIETVLDGLASEDETVMIARLDLDLGVIDSDALETELEARLVRALDRALDRYRAGGSTKGGVVTAAEAAFRRWLFYLEFGQVPWPASSLAESAREGLTLPEIVGTEMLLERLVEVLWRSHAALIRLARESAAEPAAPQLEALLHPINLLDEKVVALTSIMFTSGPERGMAGDVRSYVERFWRALWTSFLDSQGPPRAATIIGSAVSRMAVQSGSVAGLHGNADLADAPSRSRVVNAGPASETLGELLQLLRQAGFAITEGPRANHLYESEKVSERSSGSRPGPDNDVDPGESDAAMNAPGAWPAEDVVRPAEQRDDIVRPATEQLFEETDTEPVHVANSGLVLLTPYLTLHFESLGWVRERRFTSVRARHYAVRQLQYLATGIADVPEYRLVLNKVLCGLRTDTVQMDLPEYSEEEEREADALLRAVVGHWKALKSTSPDGLRDAFLKREGTLLRREDGWLLRVERRAIDVLLTRVPWSFQVVKLPWMPDLLRVEWI